MVKESLVLDLVLPIRKKMPRIGSKKLYHMLSGDLQNPRVGRDKFNDILRENDLLLKRKRSYTKTTQSHHRFRKWKNLVKDRVLPGSNRAWAGDITYLRTTNGFVYLFLITDLYSRKIVGWSLGNSLSIEGALKALKMALKSCTGDVCDLIHHSDRGIQYCSCAYVDMLQKHGIQISMTEENHCYENATAERVNGILKDEFLLDGTFKNIKDAYKSTTFAIEAYNNYRPHWSLGLKTPSQVHLQSVA